MIIFVLALMLAAPSGAKCDDSTLHTAFAKLSGIEAALATLSRQIDKAAGMDSQPDRVYAMQDMSGLCKSSKMQVHSLNSLFSVVKLIKSEKRFESDESRRLKKQCGYAFNDFNRRRVFVLDILKKAKDQTLRDLAHIFDAQLGIAVKQLTKINAKLN